MTVALQVGTEELCRPGFAVVKQEMAQVEIRVGAAHLAEVDNAAVAAGVSVDVGDVQIPVDQMPAAKRPVLLADGKCVQGI